MTRPSSTEDWAVNPVDYEIIDVTQYIDVIKKLIDFDEDIEASVAEQLKQHPDKDKIWNTLPPEIQIEVGFDNRFCGRKKQQILDPETNPMVVYCAGRSFGKTFIASAYAKYWAENYAGCRISIVGATVGDIRGTILRGESGIEKRSHPDRKPIYTPSTRTVVWRNGSLATTFSAEVPDTLAGSQCRFALVDELFLAPYQQETWDQLMFTLRLGGYQQVVVTSTPRPTALAKELLNPNNEEVTLVTGNTSENTSMSESFHKRMEKKYAGSRLGRQELNAELLMDNPDSLFESESIESNRVSKSFFNSIRDQVDEIVVAVDPSTTNNKSSDLCGICIAARVEDDCYILQDLSLKALPEAWAEVVVDAYNLHGANKIVCETNQGGDMVELVLRQKDATAKIKKIHARFGKFTRAEPVSTLYAQGRVHHVGTFEKMEDEMVSWSPKLGKNQKSPDRMDSLVYAVTELMIQTERKAWCA